MKSFVVSIILGLDNPDGLATVEFLTDDLLRSLAKIPITIPNIKPLSVAEIEIIAIRQSLNVMKEILENQGQKE